MWMRRGRFPTLVAGITVLAIVFSIVYSAVHGAKQIDDLIASHQTDQRELHAAAVERRELLHGQRKQQKILNDLVDWLQDVGINVPAALVTGLGSVHGDMGNGSSSTRRIVRKSTNTTQRQQSGGGSSTQPPPVSLPDVKGTTDKVGDTVKGVTDTTDRIIRDVMP